MMHAVLCVALLNILFIAGQPILSADDTVGALPAQSSKPDCKPTPADFKGPFYKPNAPVRSKIGTGYILFGKILTAENCKPVAGARIEFWIAGPDRRYDDNHRATLFSEKDGSYRFECNRPISYGFRPPHIHIQISAKGYRTLVTQHYPEKDKNQASFDIVLQPFPM